MMKKSFAIILFLFISVPMFSQIQKETMLLHGSASVNFGTRGSASVYLNPGLGYFTSDNFCLGASIPLFIADEASRIGLTPYVRYFFTPQTDRSLYLRGAIGLTGLFESESFFSSDILYAGVGHVWMLNESIGFESSLNASTDFEDINMSLNFGFQIYFNRNSQ